MGNQCTTTVLAEKSSRFYIVLQCKNVNFFWPVLYVFSHKLDFVPSSDPVVVCSCCAISNDV